MKKVMVIVNPSAGEKDALSFVSESYEQYLRQFETVIIKQTQKGEDIGRFVREALEMGVDLLLFMGGDGTVHLGVQALMASDKKVRVGVLPLGTTNNLARVLGFSPNPKQAVQQLPKADFKKIDVAQVNDLYFISALSAGAVPESVQDVDEEEKERLGPLAYFLEGVKVLGDERTTTFKITHDGQQLTEDFSLFVIGNGASIAGLKNFFPDAALDDGKLHFIGLKSTTSMEKLSLIPDILSSEPTASEFTTSVDFEKMTIESIGEVTHQATVDGEVGPKLPLTIEVIPDALEFLALPSL